MSAKDIANARVLIVDDNHTNIELLIALLEEAGYQYIEGVQTPRLIDEKMASFKPDLILLDYRMPELNGAEVLKHMKQTYGDDAPPMVMLTAQGDKETFCRSIIVRRRDEMRRYFTKPLQVNARRSLKSSFLRTC